MAQVHLLLGGNLGDRKKVLQSAKSALEQTFGYCIKESSFYETAAWGKEDQGAFLNQVLVFSTDLSPHELLEKILHIESELGRIRFEKWGERVIDIDILYLEKSTIQSQRLTIPHPLIQERRFTLVPLVEISPDFIHPILNKTNAELLNSCKDQLAVYKIAD